MNTFAATFPACDELDRLDQQRNVESEDYGPVPIQPHFDAETYDLIDQAILAPLPEEDYPTNQPATTRDMHSVE